MRRKVFSSNYEEWKTAVCAPKTRLLQSDAAGSALSSSFWERLREALQRHAATAAPDDPQEVVGA